MSIFWHCDNCRWRYVLHVLDIRAASESRSFEHGRRAAGLETAHVRLADHLRVRELADVRSRSVRRLHPCCIARQQQRDTRCDRRHVGDQRVRGAALCHLRIADHRLMRLSAACRSWRAFTNTYNKRSAGHTWNKLTKKTEVYEWYSCICYFCCIYSRINEYE